MPITASQVNPTSQSAEAWLPLSLNPFFEVAAVVLVVGAASAYLPARHIASINPIEILRPE